MNRMIPRTGAVPGGVLLIALGGLCLLAGPAAAEPSNDPTPNAPPLYTVDGRVARRIAVDTPIEMYATPNATVSQTIYLERCKGGCAVHQGSNDARTYTSTIPMNAESTIGEFANSAGLTGAAADSEWNAVVACMREVYSPFAVTVTDTKPTNGAGYHMAIIAGQPGDTGLSNDILGVAPLSNDCRAIDNVISFTFANHHAPLDRVFNICWTAAQESAHAYGLDHEYSFTTGNVANGHSACNDPMTYRTDCGGQKFFRNEDAKCGENTTRACKCGATQNSHLKILGVFGMGTPNTGMPNAAVTGPPAATVLTSSSVIAVQAGAKRGVSHVELYFNGYKWSDQAGTSFGPHGQLNPDTYAIKVPANLPDSIVDVKAVAYDDLGVSGESAVTTFTKGAACTNASSCAKGQKCDAGKCFWDPPTGEIGATCSYDQFCKSALCTGTADQKICTQSCIPGVSDSCPMGLDCIMNGDNSGVCFFSSTGGGCCSVDRGGVWWLHIGLAAMVLALITRRKRR